MWLMVKQDRKEHRRGCVSSIGIGRYDTELYCWTGREESIPAATPYVLDAFLSPNDGEGDSRRGQSLGALE